MAEDKSIISYDNIIAPTDVFDDLFANLDSLESRLKKIAKGYDEGLKVINVNDIAGIEKYSLAIRKLELAQEKLRLKKEALSNARKKNIVLTNEQLIQAQKEKQIQADRRRRAKQLAIIQAEQGNTIKSLRAQLSLASLDWSKLTEEEIKNGRQGKILSKRKLDLTNRLKALEKQTGDTRRNVGNYTNSLSKLGKTAARVFIGRTAVDFFRRIATGAKALIDANKAGSQSLTELDDSLNETGGALKQVATVLLTAIAPALTFVINGFKSFLGLFFDINNESDKFTATSEELKNVISGLEKEFVKEAGAVDQVFTALEGANKGSKERKDLIEQINSQYGKYLPNLLTEKSTLQEIERAQTLVNNALTKNFLIKIQQETQTDIFTNKVKAQVTQFERLQKVVRNTGGTLSKEFLGQFSSLIEGFNEATGSGADARRVIESVAFSGLEAERRLEKTNPKLLELALALKAAGNETGIVSVLSEAAKQADNYNGAIDGTNNALKGLQEGLNTYDRSLNSNTSTTKENTKTLKDNTAERLKAIEELQKELSTIEVENIQDRQERALALEELRFKEEQKLREQNFDTFIELAEEQEQALINFYGENSKEVIEFRTKAGQELLEVEALNLKLSEQQLRQSEENKLNIRKQFALDTNELVSINVLDQDNEVQKLLDQEVATIEDGNKRKKDSYEELSKSIVKSTAEASKAIQSIFDAEAKAATDAVEAQTTAVANAEARAQAGLENTLKFEQEQLAQKEQQRLQAERRAKQAAEALALINLTVAAAQSGDKNAVQTGLVQFGVLKGLVAAIGSAQGFYEGTENIGKSLGNKGKFFGGNRDAYLAITKGGTPLRVDGTERIVPGFLNKQLGNMSNEELKENAIRGAAMSDYNQPYMLLGSEHYKSQTKKILKASNSNSSNIDLSRLKDEMSRTRKAIEQKPIVKEELTTIIDNVATITRRTVKNRMTKIETIKKRL